MRILTRRASESFRVGSDIVITVLRVRGDMVRMRIATPEHIRAYRAEVVEDLNHAAQSAAQPAAEPLLPDRSDRATSPMSDGGRRPRQG